MILYVSNTRAYIALSVGKLLKKVEVDSDHIGFTYIHEKCMDKKRPEEVTYKW